jgi:integrase
MPQDWFLFGRGMKPGPVSLSRNMVSKRHSEVLRSLNYPSDLTLYSWKHTGVVAAYKAGIDLYSIMRQLRHHSLDMTQIYLKSLGLVKNEQFGRMMV